MKAGLLAGLRAIAALRTAGRLAGGSFERIRFVANPDEEIGSPTSTPHIVEIARESDACLRARVRPRERRLRLGAQGHGRHPAPDHGRPRMPASSPRRAAARSSAGAELVREIHALNGRWPDVTANVGVFKAGTRPNIVCDEAELQVDVRAMPRSRWRDRRDRRARREADRARRDRRHRDDAQLGADGEARAVRPARRPRDRARPAARVRDEDAATGGASGRQHHLGDGRADDRGLGPIGGMDHSPEEYLEVDSIVPRTALLAALLLEVGRDPIVASWRAPGR